ncbi:MAG: hypothetical protein ACYC1L_10015 [Alphaproteobacteria bacterium]
MTVTFFRALSVAALALTALVAPAAAQQATDQDQAILDSRYNALDQRLNPESKALDAKDPWTLSQHDAMTLANMANEYMKGGDAMAAYVLSKDASLAYETQDGQERWKPDATYAQAQLAFARAYQQVFDKDKEFALAEVRGYTVTDLDTGIQARIVHAYLNALGAPLAPALRPAAVTECKAAQKKLGEFLSKAPATMPAPERGYYDKRLKTDCK